MHISLILLLCSSWFGYFLIHSVLASNVLKCWVVAKFPKFLPYYRLTYNLVAILLLLPPLAVLYLNNWHWLWRWPETLYWLQTMLAVLSITGFVASLGMYSGLDFLGLSQAKQKATVPKEQLRISTAHRFVRHPWYFLALLYLWSRDMDLGFFVTSLAITLYFFVGSRLEERKLIHQFGPRTTDY